jgi:RNA polymerase sigma factor for flagellar operon FliA
MGRGPKLTEPVLRKTIKVVEESGTNAKAALLLGISVSSLRKRLAVADGYGLRTKSVQKKPAATKPAKPALAEKPIDPETAKARLFWWQQYVDGGRQDQGLLHVLLQKETGWLQARAGKMSQSIGGAVEPADLYQEGYIGLIEAARTFEPRRGLNFSTYGSRRAVGAMLDYLRSLDIVPRIIRSRTSKYAPQIAQLKQELGREPTTDEICQRLKITHRELMTNTPKDTVSTDTLLHEEGWKEMHIKDMLQACCDSPDQNSGFESYCRRIFSGLSLDDQTLCWLYIVRGSTMKNIGLAFGMSESRISQRFTSIKGTLFERIRKDCELVDKLRELATA